MSPEAKKIITAIEEIICDNCVLSERHWQEQKTSTARYCRLHLLDQKDDFAQITNSNFFCADGLWIISVAQERKSLVGFQLAYDYLME